MTLAPDEDGVTLESDLFNIRYKTAISVGPDLAKFHHFGKYFKFLGNEIPVYLVLGKVFSSLWHNLYAFVASFHCCKWPNIKNKIWSHWAIFSIVGL